MVISAKIAETIMNSNVVFMGEFEVAVDEKKRVMIPSKWKSSIGQEIVLCEGFEGAIELRSKSVFYEYYGKLSQNNEYSKHVRILKRKILGTAREIILDKWFRFVIPSNLVKTEKLTGSLIMRGNGDSIEIWDKKQYQEWAEKEDNTVEKAADALAYSKAKSPAEVGDIW